MFTRLLFVIIIIATYVFPFIVSGAQIGALKLDKPKLEAYLRYAEGYVSSVKIAIDDPSPSNLAGYYRVAVHLIRDIATAERIYYTPDGEHFISGAIWDLNNNPFLDILGKLPTNGFSFGPSDAKVTIVIFSDLECPYCRELANTVRSNIAQKYPNDVHVIFEDFPLESIHKWARAAAEAGRCLGDQKQEAFWSWHDWVFQHQHEVNETNLRDNALSIAKQQNLDPSMISTCIDSHAKANQVDESVRAGQALHVQQTPTFFVNGRLVSGAVPWSTLDAIIQLELEHHPKLASTTAGNTAFKP